MANKPAGKSSKAANKVPAKKVPANKAAAKAVQPRKAAAASRSKSASQSLSASKGARPKLLSGGNPQIAKGDGDAPVQAYIDAMPGWKKELGRRLDDIIVRTVPSVHKAVKWNTPFYGFEGQGWFAAFHCFTKYVKVTFFRGTSLRPVPLGASKHPEVRYLDIHEGEFDAAQFTDWVKQASKLPGEKM